MLLLGDPHYGDVTDSVDIDGISSKSYETTVRIKEAIDVAAKHKHTVIITGDVFDSKAPSPEAIREVVRILNYASSAGVNVVLFPGNHDSGTKWTALIAVAEIDFEHTTLVTTPTYLHFEGVDAFILPHIPKSEEAALFEKHGVTSYTELVAKHYKNKHFDVLISHAQVQGVQGSSEREMEAGNAISLEMPGLPATLPVYVGHVHNYTLMTTPIRQVVCYPGSIIPHTFGELNVDKGYVMVSSTNLSKPVFHKFESEMQYQYAHLKINLVGKTHLEVTDSKLRELTTNKLLKITVRVDDRRNVDLIGVRQTLSKYGRVMKFEVIDSSTKALTSSSAAESIHTHLDHMSLLRDALIQKQNQGIAKDVLLLAARLGKEIIKHAD